MALLQHIDITIVGTKVQAWIYDYNLTNHQEEGPESPTRIVDIIDIADNTDWTEENGTFYVHSRD